MVYARYSQSPYRIRNLLIRSHVHSRAGFNGLESTHALGVIIRAAELDELRQKSHVEWVAEGSVIDDGLGAWRTGVYGYGTAGEGLFENESAPAAAFEGEFENGGVVGRVLSLEDLELGCVTLDDVP